MKNISNENKLEIKCRETVLKKLATVKKQLEGSVQKENKKREEEFKALSVYQTYEEIQDVYAYGEMTDEQRYMAIALLENHEKQMEYPTTNNSAALSILNNFCSTLNREIRDFKWECLSDTEKEAVAINNAKFRDDLGTKCRGKSVG